MNINVLIVPDPLCSCSYTGLDDICIFWDDSVRRIGEYWGISSNFAVEF